jgi:hypothetical protein
MSTLRVDNIEEYTSNNTIKLDSAASETVNTVSSSSGTLVLNATSGGFFKVTLTEDITTWTINNLPAGRVTVLTIVFTQDTTARTVVSSINSTAAITSGGSGWTMSTDSGAIDVVTIMYDGTNYFLIPQQNWS